MEAEGNVKHYDSMEGVEFEQFCADLLRNNGYINVEVTSGSGDFGVDILAEKGGVTYAIQCKRSNSPIGNAAVQEIFSGREFYKRHVGVVMTNNYFTQSAKETAQRTGIVLWDRDALTKLAANSRNAGNIASADKDVISTIINLEEIHHLLVFGATGSGKSNLLHCIIQKLLQDNLPKTDLAKELHDTAYLLIDTLRDFGILSRIIDIFRESDYTRYEVQPTDNADISKIKERTKDIAKILTVPSIRIEDIPNKDAVGVDIPNYVMSSLLYLIDIRVLEFNVYNGIKRSLRPQFPR